MKTKKTKEEKPRLWITYTQDSEGGEICEGDEDSDWPNYETTYITTYFDSAATINVDRPHGKIRESFEVPEGLGDKVYFAVITYSDGDTFGSSSGHIQLEGPFLTREDAVRAEAAIRTIERGGPENGYSFTGYFASLIDVEVKEFAVVK